MRSRWLGSMVCTVSGLATILMLDESRAVGQVAARVTHSSTKAHVRAAALTQREQALQMLRRFTFGPRPGEVEKVLALGQDGPQQWFEKQLEPASIDDSVLEKRLAAYPTLNMTAAQILSVFPDNGTIRRIADGKQPYPTDPQLAAMYEVQVYKYNKKIDDKAATPTAQDGADAPRQQQIAQDKATASRIAGDLFAMPAGKRMAALLALPVADRIAFTKHVEGEQRTLLLADLTPKERELFLAMSSGVGSSQQAVSELQQARILRDILSERQLQAVMADFWFNHFNIYAPKESDQWYTTGYERDVIRKNALGKFSDLLLATAQSPAMMVYLDNWLSVGPDSVANTGGNGKGKRGSVGLNENYAREVMELHTLGVDGGYTQADVTQLARMLTGWSVDRPQQAGPFAFDARRHEPGTKPWLGQTIPAGGFDEGVNALKALAASPKTAHFISWKLAQRFVADEPPAALVDQMTQSYLASDGDVKTVLRTMVHSREFNTRTYFGNKVKTPVEFVASAFRSTSTDPGNPGALVGTIEHMGMPLYKSIPPTGYYITADKWMNTSALIDRLNFALQLTSGKMGGQKFDSPRLLALALLSQSEGGALSTMAPSSASQERTKGQVHALKIVRPLQPDNAGSGVPSKVDEPMPHIAAGTELALNVLESSLVGSGVSLQTNGLIRQQLTQTTAAQGASSETLGTLIALVLGAPEFQFR